MARKNPLPPREIEVCQRLRAYRMLVRYSRVVFAQQSGLDSSLLASYEHCRVPLPYKVARKILSRFQLSPAWLATGQGRHFDRHMAALPSLEELHASPLSLFSDIYDRHLAKLINDQEARSLFPAGAYVEPLVVLGGASPKERVLAEEYIANRARVWMERVPDSQFNEFCHSLLRCASRLLKSCDAESVVTIEKRATEMDKLRIEREAEKGMEL